MNTRLVGAALAALLVAISAPHTHAATVVADGLYPQISSDGLSLYYWSSYNRTTQDRIRRTLATSTDVPAPLPSLPENDYSDDMAFTPSERYVAWSSYNDLNLSPYDDNEQGDIYILDT